MAHCRRAIQTRQAKWICQFKNQAIYTQAGSRTVRPRRASLRIYCLIFKLTDPFRLPSLDRPAAMGHFRKDLILLEIDLESPVFVGRENVGFLQHFAIFLQEIRLSIQCQETGLHETCIR